MLYNNLLYRNPFKIHTFEEIDPRVSVSVLPKADKENARPPRKRI